MNSTKICCSLLAFFALIVLLVANIKLEQSVVTFTSNTRSIGTLQNSTFTEPFESYVHDVNQDGLEVSSQPDSGNFSSFTSFIKTFRHGQSDNSTQFGLEQLSPVNDSVYDQAVVDVSSQLDAASTSSNTTSPTAHPDSSITRLGGVSHSQNALHKVTQEEDDMPRPFRWLPTDSTSFESDESEEGCPIRREGNQNSRVRVEAHDIQELCVIGERHSGTNWLHAMLESAFDVPVQNGYTRWKHWFQIQRRNSRFLGPLDRKLAIVLVRNPYDWLQSFHKWPYHASWHNSRFPKDRVGNVTSARRHLMGSFGPRYAHHSGATSRSPSFISLRSQRRSFANKEPAVYQSGFRSNHHHSRISQGPLSTQNSYSRAATIKPRLNENGRNGINQNTGELVRRLKTNLNIPHRYPKYRHPQRQALPFNEDSFEDFLLLNWTMPTRDDSSDDGPGPVECSTEEGFQRGEVIPCQLKDYLPGFRMSRDEHDIYETDPETLQVFGNVLELRAAKLMWWIKMLQWAPHVELVRYEDLMTQGGNGARRWLSELKEKYRLPCAKAASKQDVKNPGRSTKSRSCSSYIWSEDLVLHSQKGDGKPLNLTEVEKNMFTHRSVNQFSDRDKHRIQLINPLLNETAEACWGYASIMLPESSI